MQRRPPLFIVSSQQTLIAISVNDVIVTFFSYAWHLLTHLRVTVQLRSGSVSLQFAESVIFR